jgi:predicted metal-dependent phosphoesterase TrpH
MNYANLHLHSTFSDGGFTPAQLVLIGKSLGYKALAMTDHETDGGVTEFQRVCAKEGLDSLVGVEFYGRHDGHGPHLVALDFDRDNPDIRAFIRERCELYTECTRKRVERGIRLGYIRDFTWNDVLDYARDGSWICIDHVIGAMKYKRVMAPEASSDELRKNVFKGEEALSFEPAQPSAERVIKIIRKAGGIAVLAHPVNKTQYVRELIDYGLNGIEVCHPIMDAETTRLAQEAAKAFQLYRSGGTDHTGAMSACGGANAVPALQGVSDEEFYTIKERRLG